MGIIVILVLGVANMPYVDADPPKKVGKAKKGKANKPKKSAAPKGDPQTTGEVAKILEDKYQVMEHYVQDAMPFIQNEMIKALEASIVNLNPGLPVQSTPFNDSNDAIAQNFREFLDNSVIEHMGVPGVPTQAAKDGVQSRYKLFKGPRRPSFVDSGTYQAYMKVWVE